ncbi:conserved hypothetical protein [Verrucomicrobia bacterium]|nr:conserved hypothetical protein [Verrucomicrobiota bacterium]
MKSSSQRAYGRWFVASGGLLVIILELLLPRPGTTHDETVAATNLPSRPPAESFQPRHRPPARGASGVPEVTAEQIVAGKLDQFITNREAIMRGMAQRYHLEVAPDVERFFAAARAGRWEEITNAFATLVQRRKSGENCEDLHTLWGPILETFGVAESAHSWPAQRLLDYGNAVLGSLSPAMVYVGGTDPGRFIPTLLNETSDGEQHIILTQNALADNTYLQYVEYLHNNQMSTLTSDESQRAFQEYITAAQKRLEHDQQFPDEPKQLLSGEDIQVVDNRVQASGQVAVMGINEKLLQMIMDKNPDLNFALEESFPLKSTYAQAAPLGPIMQLGVQDEQNTFTTARADQAVDYWRNTAEKLLSDPETPDGSDPRKAYAKMAASQAGLLADHNFSSEAEQTYQLATQISPSSPEAVFQLVSLLVGQNRVADALPVVQGALNADPSNDQFRNLLQNLSRKQNGN